MSKRFIRNIENKNVVVLAICCIKVYVLRLTRQQNKTNKNIAYFILHIWIRKCEFLEMKTNEKNSVEIYIIFYQKILKLFSAADSDAIRDRTSFSSREPWYQLCCWASCWTKCAGRPYISKNLLFILETVYPDCLCFNTHGYFYFVRLMYFD